MKLIMFDVDGTLTASYKLDTELLVQAVRSVLHIESINTNWSDYKYVTSSGILSEIVFNKFERKVTKEEEYKVKLKFESLLQKQFDSNPKIIESILGANKLFEKLYAKSSVAVCIATGDWSNTSKLKLKLCYNIYNIPYSSSCDHYDRKEIMKKSESKSKLYYQMKQFNEIIYVGDGESMAFT